MTATLEDWKTAPGARGLLLYSLPGACQRRFSEIVLPVECPMITLGNLLVVVSLLLETSTVVVRCGWVVLVVVMT